VSFLEECQAVEPGYNGVNAWSVLDEIDGAEIVQDEIIDQRRWVTVNEAVLRKGTELVGLKYESPSTEVQEGGDFDHEFYEVEPYEVTVTKYRKVK
jgi:hypothetical protein